MSEMTPREIVSELDKHSSQRSWLKFRGMNRRRNSVSKRYSANVRRSN